jgi:5,10-methylenetetrahydromethanopterin reductase
VKLIASIDVISGGRGFLLIGRGDRAVHDVGLRPAPVDQLRAYVLAIRAIFAGGSGSYAGRTSRGAWPNFWDASPARRIRSHLAAEGPRMLRLAGEIADGVMIGSGLTPEIVAESLAHGRAGAEAARRTCNRPSANITPATTITPKASASAEPTRNCSRTLVCWTTRSNALA